MFIGSEERSLEPAGISPERFAAISDSRLPEAHAAFSADVARLLAADLHNPGYSARADPVVVAP